MSAENSADERLARLAARRQTVADEVAAPSAAPARTVRRVPPARSAKIVTVGLSTTSMLGVMAAMAIADRPAAPPETSQPTLELADPPPATLLVAVPVPVVLDVDVPLAAAPTATPVPTTSSAPVTNPAPTAAPAPPPLPAAQATTSGS